MPWTYDRHQRPQDVGLRDGSSPPPSSSPTIHHSQLGMNLPRELLDEIFSHLHSDDRRSFQDCSLVAKSWVNPSRRRLFETVHIRRATTLRAWRVNIPPVDDRAFQQLDLALDSWWASFPPANSGLLEYVRWVLRVRWVNFPPEGLVRESPAQALRHMLRQLQDLIPPAEDGLLHCVRSLLQSWRDTIPPGDVELLHHVRSLSYIADMRNGGNIWPPRSIEVLRNYFPSLHQLRHLSLSFVCLSSSTAQDVGVFSAFRHSLSRLSLSSCDFSVSTLVSLINYFPNLNILDLIRPRSPMDGKLTRPLSRPLLGQLQVSELDEEKSSIFDQLSELGLAFDEIVFDGPSPVSLQTLGHIINTVGARVKCLRLSNPPKKCTHTTLHAESSAIVANQSRFL